MSVLAWILLVDTLLVVILMLSDRILQAVNRPPGLLFDAVQLWAALLGVILHAGWQWGWLWLLKFSVISIVLPYVCEFLGQKTGFPFGRYQYTEKAGPKLPGSIPVAVVLMWWGLLYVTFSSGLLCSSLIPVFNVDVVTIFFASILLVGWDLTGDPVAVHAGMWVWEKPRGWYGIPWSNFAGWFGVSVFTMMIFRLVNGPFALSIENTRHNADFYLSLVPLILLGVLYFNYMGAACRRRLRGPGVTALIFGFGIVTACVALKLNLL